MKNVQVAIGLVSALLLANAGSAESLTIQWQQTGLGTGNGYLPKVASDGISSTALIYGINTGFSRFEYETGDISTSWILGWSGPYNIFSSTQPGSEVGHAASIAMVNCPLCSGLVDDVIQVHQGGQDDGAALWYRTGVLTGSPEVTWAAAEEYDEGYNPSVAVDQGTSTSSYTTVVEVHQAGIASSELWYHVGKLTYSKSSVKVTWGPAYDSGLEGYAPTVTVYNGLVVLAAQGTAPNLWYSLGVVDTGTDKITWGAAKNYDTGYNPTVSVYTCGFSPFACGGWLLVEAHQGSKGTGSLWYRIGVLSTGGGGSYPTAISWAPNSATKYASTGCYPSVTELADPIGTNNEVVETHSAECGAPADLTSSWGFLGLK